MGVTAECGWPPVTAPECEPGPTPYVIGKLEPQIIRMAEGRYAVWIGGEWWELRPLKPGPPPARTTWLNNQWWELRAIPPMPFTEPKPCPMHHPGCHAGAL